MFEDNLRRRTLYPAELLGHKHSYSTEIFSDCQAQFGTFFRANGIYCPIVFQKGVSIVEVAHTLLEDLDDLIFEESDGGPSER